jgi:hypothetical protein
MHRHLKPGGWLESVELSVIPKSDDNTIKPDSTMHKWGQIALEAGDAFGKSVRVVDEVKQGMIDAGFIEVKEHRYKLPIGGMSRLPI